MGLIFTFGAYSFYFSILYSESLYLILLLITLFALERREYLFMGLAGAFLSATRNTGIMVVFAVGVKVIMNYIEDQMCIRDRYDGNSLSACLCSCQCLQFPEGSCRKETEKTKERFDSDAAKGSNCAAASLPDHGTDGSEGSVDVYKRQVTTMISR